METKIFSKNEVKAIEDYIKKGKVIAFPTDTVFGVGVIYGNEKGLQNLKNAKQREEGKPIPLMVSSLSQLMEIAFVDERARLLAKSFMPGPLTLVLRKRQDNKGDVIKDMDTIAIRIPDDEFVLSILKQPMFVTSANLSGETPGFDEQEVLKQLGGRIDGIVRGRTKSESASTIVDLSGDVVKVLREGKIKEQEIKKVLQEVNR